MGKFKNLKIVLILALLVFLSFSASIAQALTFDDLIESGKKLLGSEKTPKGVDDSKIEITSDIQLTEKGDLNNNGEMDGGDTVRFSFVLSNGTDKPYPFSKLKTNIRRDAIHFIHNVQGVTGIDNTTLELPNIYVLPNSKQVISFDAKLNFIEEEDNLSVKKTVNDELSSQGTLEDNKQKKMAESPKKVKKIKKSQKKESLTSLKVKDKEASSPTKEKNTAVSSSSASAQEVGLKNDK